MKVSDVVCICDNTHGMYDKWFFAESLVRLVRRSCSRGQRILFRCSAKILDVDDAVDTQQLGI